MQEDLLLTDSAAAVAVCAEITKLQSTSAEIQAGWDRDRALDQRVARLRRDLMSTRKQGGRVRREQQVELEGLLKERRASSATSSRVDVDAVAAVIADRVGISTARLRMSEADRLLGMESEIHEAIIGQDEAVTAVCKAIRRSRVGLQKPRKPIASFLFRGPSGVGKTETARALAKFLFADPEAVIRIDMSEFSEKHTLARLTGAAPGLVGYSEGGVLTNAVLNRPMSIVLLDEVEKAHREATDLFLQVLDAGRLTDSVGRAVSFSQTVVILTTNLPTTEAIEHHFRPEFLNRLDGLIQFQALSKEQLVAIAKIAVEETVDVAKSQHQIHVEYGAEVLEAIVDWSADARYGARPIHRAVVTMLADPLATALLHGGIQTGARYKVTVNSSAKELVVTAESGSQ